MKHQRISLAFVLIGGVIGYSASSGQSAPATAPSIRSDESKFLNPTIRDYGAIVKLPMAAQQPCDGSKIVVDVTKGGEPDKLNSAIEKVARFVNIYQGAGEKPAKVNIAVVCKHRSENVALVGAKT